MPSVEWIKRIYHTLSRLPSIAHSRRNSGSRVDRPEWHRIVSFQPGLVDMLTRNARKDRLVHVAGKNQTRRWRKDGEDSDRFSTEILLVPGSRIQFLDKANGTSTPDGQAANDAPAHLHRAPRFVASVAGKTTWNALLDAARLSRSLAATARMCRNGAASGP